jgi:membrane-bound serine protease (ClpP class)
MVALGILLLVVGVGLIIGEFFTGAHVMIGLGTLSLIVGLVFLATSGSPWFQVNWWLVSLILVIIVVLVVLAVLKIKDTYRHQVITGKEDLRGKIAVVKQPLDPEGIVSYEGELWRARSGSGKIEAGEEVIITRVNGLKLSVTRKKDG